jgi:hypothetical protein
MAASATRMIGHITVTNGRFQQQLSDQLRSSAVERVAAEASDYRAVAAEPGDAAVAEWIA